MHIRILDAAEHVTDVTAARGGIGAVSVPPGRYSVDLGSDAGCTPSRFSIAASRTTTVHYWCQEP